MLKKTLLLTLTICAAASLSIPQPAYAQIRDFKITASDGAAFDEFGKSVSISGDYAVVGAYFDDDNGFNAGSAYIFKRTGTSWAQEAKLVASDGEASDLFGVSVSIDSNYAVVGAFGDDDNGFNAGSAYIFKRTGTSWAQEAKLLPSDGTANDEFGYSVSISGDLTVIGARFDDDNGTDAGSAYIFKRTGTSWAQEAKLVASDPITSDWFGWSVSIDSNYAIVGAFFHDVDGKLDAGAAYTFKRTGTSWAQEAKLVASDGEASDLFGVSVSIDSNYAVVGAFGDDDNGFNAGSAYIFKRTGTSWAQEAKLLPSDGTANDEFGKSVSVSGNLVAIGAYFDDDNGTDAGSAYIFKRSGTSWAQEAKLVASDGEASDLFGWSVSISGDYAVVGAFGDDDNGTNVGSSYLFNLHDPFVANPIQDVAVDEDFGTVLAALLNTVFNDLDLPDNDSLRFSVVVSNSILTHRFSGDTLFLHSVGDSNGVAQVIVTATDDSAAAVSDTFNITVSPIGDYPSRFSLISPLGDTLNTLLPSFLWNSSIDPDISDSTEYIIRISLTESLQSPIFTGALIDTSSTLGVPLADDSLYFWSVTAIDLSGLFSLSDTSSFLLDKQESPEVFTLISPADGSGIGSPRPVFTWEASSDPDPRDEVRYTLIVRRVTGPDSIVYKIDGLTDSTHQVSVDIEIDNYEWWVIAEDTDNNILDRPSSEIFRLNVLVGIEDEFAGIPLDFSLEQNYPNPFNPVTTIKYALPEASRVSLTMYNIRGQEVALLINANMPAGFHEVTWDASNFASGVYIYRLQAEEFVQTRKMVLLK